MKRDKNGVDCTRSCVYERGLPLVFCTTDTLLLINCIVFHNELSKLYNDASAICVHNNNDVLEMIQIYKIFES